MDIYDLFKLGNSTAVLLLLLLMMVLGKASHDPKKSHHSYKSPYLQLRLERTIMNNSPDWASSQCLGRAARVFEAPS